MQPLNRRAFLQTLGFGTVVAAAAATSVLDIERMLWVPGEKTIFIPPPPKLVSAFIIHIEPPPIKGSEWIQRSLIDGNWSEPTLAGWRVLDGGYIQACR